MKKKQIQRCYLAAIILSLLSACSFNLQTREAAFYPPIVAKEWQVVEYPEQFCAISSGHNGIEIMMKKISATTVDEIVRSTRMMEPGTMLSARVDDHSYRTPGLYFSAQQSAALIGDLQRGDTVYIEWQEQNGRPHDRLENVYTRVPLGEFKEKYQECRKKIGLKH